LSEDVHQVIIIGAGPAGLAAGIQLVRQGIRPLIFERNRVGGLLWNANWVENYPGFVEGISGPNLVRLFRDQALRLGVDIQLEEVIKAEYKDDIFRIATSAKEYSSKILVAATGTVPNLIRQEFLSDDVKDKVLAEIVPLAEVKDQHILIIGAGDAALDYALNLSRHNQVTILNRGTQIRGLSLLWERVKKTSSINYYPKKEINSITNREDGRISVKTNHSDEPLEFVVDYLITAIGRKPEYSFADKSIMESIDRLEREQRLFLIGDLKNGAFRQTSIAIADGVKTAMIIGDLLEKA
jgi:thioredoxin reductase